MNKILVANRGEIALRVMRTARRMGIQTVAIYSEADRHAPHVRFADEAVGIGPAPSNASYLRGDKIIEVALSLAADAIHPGYGFLSENAAFAEKVEKSGLIFIGPPPAAIRTMGSKLAAKEAVKAYDIPMVPGVDRAVDSVAEAMKVAESIGYPLLIKASAGGGGKGMRVVGQNSELKEQLERATSEALSAFGDGSVFIEKYVQSPRHIEVQVLADNFGHIVHLFERECSVQRRHQKVIEEAPSSILTPDLRQSIGEDAVKVARACQYRGAGTVEFLLDEKGQYYFLEMNTRLQVEHPVTEMITGIDLVEQQIRVARNEPLSFEQNDLHIQGHAIELRVYAEDPYNDFLPSIGHLQKYRLPEMKNIRLDNGYEEGMDIPIYYDPLLSKLIAYGNTRAEAIRLLEQAIDLYEVDGVATTLPFGKFVMQHPAFRSGNFDTHFVKQYFTKESVNQQQQREARLAAGLALQLYLKEQQKLRLASPQVTQWQRRK